MNKESDKVGLLRYGWTYRDKLKREALMFKLYGIRMGL